MNTLTYTIGDTELTVYEGEEILFSSNGSVDKATIEEINDDTTISVQTNSNYKDSLEIDFSDILRPASWFWCFHCGSQLDCSRRRPTDGGQTQDFDCPDCGESGSRTFSFDGDLDDRRGCLQRTDDDLVGRPSSSIRFNQAVFQQ